MGELIKGLSWKIVIGENVGTARLRLNLAAYQKCSVSSCRKYAYCSVDCWSIHDSVMGHMSAWAKKKLRLAKVRREGEEKSFQQNLQAQKSLCPVVMREIF